MKSFNNSMLIWKGAKLWRGHQRKLTEIVQDTKYPTMWRVRLPDGSLSDMLNLARARDAARALALRILNSEETAAGGGVVRQS